MTTAKKQQIRKIQATLQQINDGVKVFFNIAQYERLGLVVTSDKFGINSVGNKVKIGSTFSLTRKAKTYLNVVI